jgi:hypothetical protein
MPLYQITPNELPQVWPIAAPMLQRAIDLDPDLITIEQVEFAIRTGRTYLLIWQDPEEGITGAATVDIIDYPRERVAHVSLMGGKSIVRTHVFDEAKNWMRLMGATTAQCWAKGSLVQMYEKMGLTNTHQVMREKL